MGRWRSDELADIDPVAVDLAIRGDLPALTLGERFTATVELRRRGLTYQQIARRLHIDDHQVYRYLHRAGVVTSRVEVTS